jgi:hypothetical protein
VCPQSIASQKFDSYGQLSTDDEAAHLDAFREELRNHPNLVGYLIGYSANTLSRGTFLRRLYGDERYLVESRGLEPNRLFTIDGGSRDKLTIEMWLVPNGSAQPVLSPTQSRSETGRGRYIFDDECIQCEAAVGLDLYGLAEGLKFYAAELNRTPATHGVIVIRPGQSAYTRQALREAKRAKRLLARDYKVAANRIMINVGRRRKDGLVTAEMWILRRRA